MLSYEKLVSSVKGRPVTQLPALLAVVAEVAIRKGCFVPGGASNIVEHVEQRISAEKSGSEPNSGGVSVGVDHQQRKGEICSEEVCDYCQRQNTHHCGDCDTGIPGCHYSFVGRKLSPVA